MNGMKGIDAPRPALLVSPRAGVSATDSTTRCETHPAPARPGANASRSSAPTRRSGYAPADQRPGLDALDVLKATFPAGTVSGAPKVRAMEIIDELEPVKRGIYAGAVGYLGFHGDMDLAIAIRTAVVKDKQLHVQAGAGIVADSDPSSEWQETQNKARAILRAAELAEHGRDRRVD